MNDLLIHIEKKFGHGPYSLWKHGDFEELSLHIYRETKVRISSKTLKRIFGKDKTAPSYQPQEETLRTLYRYAGVVYQPIPESVDPHPDMPGTESEVPVSVSAGSVPRNNVYRKWLPVLLVVLGVWVVVAYWVWPASPQPRVYIRLWKTEGKIPATAYFTIKTIPTADSLFVDFGDNSPWKYLSPADTIVSHLYNIPGCFPVQVHTRTQAVSDTLQVCCQSDGWKAFGFEDYSRKKIYSIPMALATDSGRYQPSTDLLQACGIPMQKPFLTGLYYYTPLGVSADNFVYRTRVKQAVFSSEVICKGLVIWITCTQGSIKQHFNAPGCSYWLNCHYSEVELDGEKADISQFSIDFSAWHALRLENHNRQISIYLDEKKIYTQLYRKSLGRVLGVHFAFVGNGSVDYCYLQSTDGTYLLRNDF